MNPNTGVGLYSAMLLQPAKQGAENISHLATAGVGRAFTFPTQSGDTLILRLFHDGIEIVAIKLGNQPVAPPVTEASP